MDWLYLTADWLNLRSYVDLLNYPFKSVQCLARPVLCASVPGPAAHLVVLPCTLLVEFTLVSEGEDTSQPQDCVAGGPTASQALWGYDIHGGQNVHL